LYGLNKNKLPPVKGKIMVVGHTRVTTIRYPKVDYNKLLVEYLKVFTILYEKDKIFIDGFVEVSKKINVLKLKI